MSEEGGKRRQSSRRPSLRKARKCFGWCSWIVSQAGVLAQMALGLLAEGPGQHPLDGSMAPLVVSSASFKAAGPFFPPDLLLKRGVALLSSPAARIRGRP